MSRRVIEQLRYIQTFNKGFWLSAKIYSDQRGNCKCGGSFTAREIFKQLEYPVCDKCGEDPKLFRIRAKVVDINMQEKYLDLRHHNGERLKDIVDVFTALKQVKSELENGTFALRKYDSKESRDSYLLENVIAKYLTYHENRLKRGDLSPSGFANKKTSTTHLLKAFTGKDIASIRRGDIEKFKNSFTDRPRARDLALAELKSVFKYAEDIEEMTFKAPKFELIPASRKRKEVISLEVALRVIDAVEDEQYKFMMKLLTVYPVRPGELRALQWRDVDYFGNEVTFQRHFSRDILLDGRKSIKDGEKSAVNYPLTKDLKEYLLSIPRPLKKDAFVFPGKQCDFVTGKCLSNAWRKATKKLRLSDFDMYEIRHARLSQLSEQTSGNMTTLKRVSGHTNIQTLTERYVRDTSDLSEFFQ